MLQLGLGLLVVVAIISTELWSWVGWCVQLGRLLAVCFVISIIWNWFYMYKVKNKRTHLWLFHEDCCVCNLFIAVIRLLLPINKKTRRTWKASVKSVPD